jgi:hypothetical protein
VPKHQGPGSPQDHRNHKHVDSFIPDAVAHPKGRRYSLRLQEIQSTQDQDDEAMVRDAFPEDDESLSRQETRDREDRSESPSYGSDTPDEDD